MLDRFASPPWICLEHWPEIGLASAVVLAILWALELYRTSAWPCSIDAPHPDRSVHAPAATIFLATIAITCTLWFALAFASLCFEFMRDVPEHRSPDGVPEAVGSALNGVMCACVMLPIARGLARRMMHATKRPPPFVFAGGAIVLVVIATLSAAVYGGVWPAPFPVLAVLLPMVWIIALASTRREFARRRSSR